MYKRILTALDGSELAERVFPYVEALAEKFGSQIVLLRATTPPGALMAETATMSPAEDVLIDPTPIIEEEKEDASAYLRRLCERLQSRGFEVLVEMPESSPADAILEYARRDGADLIAMTTHGRTGLGRLVFGSVAEEVLHHATCPVLMVRVTEHEEHHSKPN
jgi:nucleotide-binding universal stress UspA family protein